MNTKIIKATIGLTIVMMLVSACGMIPTLGSRNLISETRAVSGYQRVDVSGAGTLEIIQDGTESLSIETDDNMMQYVTSEVRGGTLYVGLDSKLRALLPSKLSLSLHVKDLSGINSSGSWEVRSAEIKTVDLDIDVSGSGKVTVDSLTVGKSGRHHQRVGRADPGRKSRQPDDRHQRVGEIPGGRPEHEGNQHQHQRVGDHDRVGERYAEGANERQRRRGLLRRPGGDL